MKNEIIKRLELDIIRIREPQSRTAAIAQNALRWEGTEENPNGWRLMGDLANDIEEIISWLKKK